jgi:hypothetical protein
MMHRVALSAAPVISTATVAGHSSAVATRATMPSRRMVCNVYPNAAAGMATTGGHHAPALSTVTTPAPTTAAMVHGTQRRIHGR